MDRRRIPALSTAFLLSVISFSNSGMAADQAQKSDSQYDLILAGGGLSTCSSFSPKKCRKENFSGEDLQQITFRFSKNAQANFQQSQFYASLSHTQKMNINSIIFHIQSEEGDALLTKRAIRTILMGSDLKAQYQSLPDNLYFALFDFFEHRQLKQDGTRKTERVELAQNRNLGAYRVFQAFYQQAALRAKTKGKRKPTLIAITASARDPFESADFYTSVLSHFDADVGYVPLDMSLQQAINASNPAACHQLETYRNHNLSFDRARIYPERAELQRQLCLEPDRLLSLLAQADGLFFNGGDQSRTLAALTREDGSPSDALQIIKSQVAQKQLVVAGTSAGTAVQAGGQNIWGAVPMITNGDPELALKRGAFADAAPSARCSETGTCDQSDRQPGDLTYKVEGGTGLFNLGLLDTHFSERDREVRLSVFSLLTQQRFAFGVDEATALLVTNRHNGDVAMTVVGENGVFVVDNHAPQFNLKRGTNSQNANNQSTKEQNAEATTANFVSGQAHFVNEGDTLLYQAQDQTLKVTFAADSRILEDFTPASHAASRHGDWRKNISKNCGTQKLRQWQSMSQQYSVKASSQTRFAKNNKKQCSYNNLPFVIQQ